MLIIIELLVIFLPLVLLLLAKTQRVSFRAARRGVTFCALVMSSLVFISWFEIMMNVEIAFKENTLLTGHRGWNVIIIPAVFIFTLLIYSEIPDQEDSIK